jgi:hypothetical protein
MQRLRQGAFSSDFRLAAVEGREVLLDESNCVPTVLGRIEPQKPVEIVANECDRQSKGPQFAYGAQPRFVRLAIDTETPVARRRDETLFLVEADSTRGDANLARKLSDEKEIDYFGVALRLARLRQPAQAIID